MSSDSQVDPFFDGKSIFNLKSGKIGMATKGVMLVDYHMPVSNFEKGHNNHKAFYVSVHGEQNLEIWQEEDIALIEEIQD